MNKRDLRMVARLAVLTVFAWTVPERYWRPWRKATIRVQERLGLMRPQQARLGERVELMESLLARPLTTEENTEVKYRVAAGRFDDTMQILRARRPGGWCPHINLLGEDRLQQALDRRRGVVLWVATFTGSRLVVKIALHRAGYCVHHLSRPGHGFLGTEFGIRYLNPVWVRIEDRYLAERIRVTDDQTVSAVKKIRRRLAENGIVSITDTFTAKRCLRLPFLNGSRIFATGAAHFAVGTGASLLPVFTIETGYRSFDVVIGEALHPRPEGRGEVSTESLMADYSRALSEVVSRHPQLWTMWPLADPSGASGAGRGPAHGHTDDAANSRRT